MNVLVVSHTYIARINRDKWKAMAHHHPNLNLLVVFPQIWPTHLFTHNATITADEDTINCHFVALPTYRQGNEVLYTYHHRPLYTLIKQFKPDLMHVEQGDGALSYFQLHAYKKMLRLTCPTVFFTWINWTAPQTFKHRLLLSPIEKANLRMASGAVAGNAAAKEILHHKGFDKPILVLPQLGVNTTLFKPTVNHAYAAPSANSEPNVYNPARPECARSACIEGYERIKTIGFIGRLVPEKGVMLLAHAFAALHHQFTTWHLRFIGSGPAEETLRRYITDNNLAKHITIQAPIPHEQIATELQTINIIVLPSYDTPTWREQFGHVLVEAMACRIPVIGSTAGEIPNVIGSAGLVFEQRNERALAEQLNRLMADPALATKLGTLGYERVHSHYTHEAIGAATYAFWQQIS